VTSTEEYVAAGLFDPELDASNGRLELLRWLEVFGFTVEEMRDGLDVDSLGAMVGDRLLVPGERLTKAEGIEVAGIDERSFDENVRAFGLQSIDGAPGPLEMLVTESLADAAVGCSFEPAGRRMVKGFAEPITVQSQRVD
jgi:hypothetical protein